MNAATTPASAVSSAPPTPARPATATLAPVTLRSRPIDTTEYTRTQTLTLPPATNLRGSLLDVGRMSAGTANEGAARGSSRGAPSASASDGSAYLEVMRAMRLYPKSTEFVYLGRLDADPNEYDPYALGIRPYESLDPRDYYTMSASGVTHFVAGVDMDFCTLERWEREHALFTKCKQLAVFKDFRKWKGFSSWKRVVKRAKMRRAADVLRKNLFQLDGLLSRAMIEVRGECFALSEQRLGSFLTPGEPKTLDVFKRDAEAKRAEIEKVLEGFSARTVSVVDAACASALDAMETGLREFFGGHSAGSEAESLASGHDQVSSEYEYTVTATRRTEQRRLLQFVRLLDYVVCDTLRDVLRDSMKGVLAATRQCSEEEFLSEKLPPPYRKRLPYERARLSLTRACRKMARESRLAETTSKKARVEEAKRAAREAAEEALREEKLRRDEDAENAFEPKYPVAPNFDLELVVLDQLEMPEEEGEPPSRALAFVPDAATFQGEIESVVSRFAETLATTRRLVEDDVLMSRMRRALEADAGSFSDPTDLAKLVSDDAHRDLMRRVKRSLTFGFGQASEYAKEFKVFTKMVAANADASLATMVERYRAGEIDPDGLDGAPIGLDLFRRKSITFLDQKTRIERFYTTSDVGIVRINSEKLKAALLPSPSAKMREMSETLPALAAEMYSAFIAKVRDATAKLQARLDGAQEFVEQMAFIRELRGGTLDAFAAESSECTRAYALVDEFEFPVEEENRAAFQTLDSDVALLKAALEEAEGQQEDNIARFNKELDREIVEVNQEARDLAKLAGEEMILAPDADRAEVLAHVRELTRKVEAQRAEALRIANFQGLFGKDQTEFEMLNEVAEDIALKRSLWEGDEEFDECTVVWSQTVFDKIDVPAMEDKMQKFGKLAVKLERGLPPNDRVPMFKDKVEDYKQLLPVVNALLNESMKTRHWDKVEELIGAPIVRDDEFTLQKILDMGAPAHGEAIGAVSTEATQEQALEELLYKVTSKWGDVSFQVVSYKESKDTFVLGGIEEIMTALEDSMVTMATIMSSRFVKGIRSEVEKVEGQLSLFSETLDEWLSVQKNWMYLESIFSAPDIQRQLPTEAKQFFAVDKQFRDIMRKTRENDNALRAGTTPGYLESFKNANDALDRIQKNLEDYLETKRMAFPRFYFLSNDELLEILAQTKNVQAVQPHMSKCFDGIKSLDFGKDPKSVDIFAMFSGEGERVGLGKNLKARGNVEQWLSSVEAAMIASLKKHGKDSYVSYPKEERTKWVLKQPAQIVIMVSQIYWCRGVIECLESGEPVSNMLRYLEKNRADLKDMTVVVRGQLSGLHRKIIAALITIDVHARDIVEELHEAETSSTNDFKWQMQLRYYWNDEEDVCEIRQTNSRFDYAYEYLGAQSRLVVTPMTDRCYMTLTGAMHLRLGGAPAGPAGTGKTESTKDLGKALGVQCVVFNCGDNLDYKFMGKFFAGLAQCGAWACFDEFNRIDIEVLSVVAQQLLTIQNAMKAGVNRFNFEGRDMKLIHSFAVFITMNPGYAGRTELPDNLKALFRPMAMMIPDYALVAEVMLFSEGFETSKDLSRKMVKLYKLSSEQLSQQDHYDFGMRALKSVLVMAGSLKRGSPDLDEQVVLIRAMRDSNLPKFLSEDAELFEAIVSDLFPGVIVPEVEQGDLARAIIASLEEEKLQCVDKFVAKIVQMYETFNVRFGAMLVGPTGGGKTTVYRMLQNALTKLHADGHENENFQIIHTYVFNPKCIKMGELYGEYNLMTNEWTDGLGSTLIRNAVADQTKEKKWVVFDGPVDAIWIENMNTVLDDNCTLCLPNGERIKLNPGTMRMLFEVQDLAVASPATVSRCGMVYVPPEELGWRPYVKSWAETQLPEACTDATREWILDVFDRTIDDGIKFVRKNCKEGIPTVDINLVTSLTYLFKALVAPDKGVDFSASVKSLHAALAKVFVFSFVWSIGGNLDAEYHDAFDEYARDVLASKIEELGNLPPKNLVYDYTIVTDNPEKPKGEWAPWGGLIEKFKYSSEVPYFELLVPNVDTTRFSFLLERCLEVDKSLLLTGGTGVGKSVIITDYLARSAEPKDLIPIVLNFSAQTPALDTQLLIESKLEKKRKTKFGAPPNKKIVLFVDDVNMPAREKYGAQPPVELLRQFQDFRGFYDRKKLFWKDVEDTTLIAACAPPGGGRQEVTPRFFRHFNMLNVPPPSDQSMKTILGSIYSGFLSDFPKEFGDCVKPVVDSSVEVYRRMSAELLPTPAKSHYTFNLRDLSKVLQGILLIRPDQCKTRDVMTRLWVHESMRVFHDRLICVEDKEYYKQMVAQLVKKNFSGGPTYDELFVERNIIFGDFFQPGQEAEERVYQESGELDKMVKLMEEYLEEYNFSSTNTMNLVFFMDAAEHTTRIARILRQPRGNAMLVGVGGSGKQSLTRFASFMAGFKCFSIELTRGYGISEFREDLKNLYAQTGIEGVPTVFLFTDTQIVSESFVEDINNILNSGEVPALFDQTEKDRMCADIRPYAEKMGLPMTKDVLYTTFINRVRDNLHIILCMSPVGEAFRSRCRQFPSLINCCTIDWYMEWPAEALNSVSQRFLSQVDLGSDETRDAVASMCVDIHTSVAETSERFFQELRRKFYTTPKSYLDLINLYTSLLAEKREELGNARDRLLNGLMKLDETNELVANMKIKLGELQPVLVEKSAATEILLVEVAKDKEAAAEVETAVAAEEEVAKKSAAEVEAIANDAQADLDEAMPKLNAALESLESLNKDDVDLVKSFATPPVLVQKTMSAVCILLGEKTEWADAKKLLNKSDFMQSLVNYDKDKISPKKIKALKKYIDDPDFVPEKVEKSSKAAKSLCEWARAMDLYVKVKKVVAPKEAKRDAAKADLEVTMGQLKEKQDKLQAVRDNVASLEAQLQAALEEQQNLKDQAELTVKRLERAEKLTTGLADEQVRWKDTADELGLQTDLLVGDVFLSAACIAYFGAFTGSYRDELVQRWVSRCKELDIPVTDDCTLRGTLASAVEVRDWNIWGLPTDNVSVDNGILVTRGKRWPLMIDPQNQANAWVKAMEQKNALKVIKLTDKDYLRTLESSIRIGNPVLVEDVGEELDPALEPILQKAVFTQNGRTLIRLGDTDVDYDPNFKFYVTTKMPNPHYLPEVCIKVTIINFTVTIKGLEDQLLGDVVRKERPDLEEQKDSLVVSISNDKKQLKDLEDKILKLLKESQGNILDDEVLINTLQNSKITSGQIGTRLEEAEETEFNINKTRETYRTAAVRGSILYFVIADLALIGPMYQYSLNFFMRMFNNCIDNSREGASKKGLSKEDGGEGSDTENGSDAGDAAAPSEAASAENDDGSDSDADSDDEDAKLSAVLTKRLDSLMEYTTRFMFENVCRGLFEEHKLLYSFLLCTSVLRASESIEPAEWGAFLRGTPLNYQAPPKPESLAEWVSDAVWRNVAYLEAELPGTLEGFGEELAGSDSGAFRVWAESDEPFARDLPGEWEEKMSPFVKLAVVKIFREETAVRSAQQYVGVELGEAFTEAPPWTLDDVFPETDARTPVIFILSTGADPTAMLQRFATKKGWIPGERLHIVSLGQGQGPYAESLVEAGQSTGDWVCLQNCHLAKSWMLSLEKLVEDLGQPTSATHDDFRLWLTSMPAAIFPVLVLQNGIKLTNEPPKGVRANMKRTFNDLTEEQWESCSKPRAYKKLTYALSTFHAVIQERRKFGPLGWNIRYEFNASDIECSMLTLKMFLEEQEEIPWAALVYVTGQINYGGRVTDDLDRRCLMSILKKYYLEAVMDDEHRFTPSGTYYAPPEGDIQSYRDFINDLPLAEAPEVFGMHPNANITFQMQETKKMMDTVLSIQPRASSAEGAKSPDELVAELAKEIAESIAPPMDVDDAFPGLFDRTETGQLKSLSVVLGQEMERFNKLTRVVTASLKQLQLAIKGVIVMTGELEMMHASLLNNRVPGIWEEAAYPSLKPLGGWIKDYHARIAMMDSWLKKGNPKSYWLPGFFFPQGFMTGVLQTHARKYQQPIDSLNFTFDVLNDKETAGDVTEAPEDGVLIDGLFVDNARWNRDGKFLDESEPGVMCSNLPVVHFIPIQNYVPPPLLAPADPKEYQCPLYKTSVRAGILSTTGQSTNFVLCVGLPIRPGTDSDFWVLQGVALLCALNE